MQNKVEKIAQSLIPSGNKLYFDYLSGSGRAAEFFSHSPLDFSGALKAREDHVYPRKEISSCLEEFNLRLGAHPRAIENIQALREKGTYSIITGQQAGFLGGPIYTLYKILTAIRLAAFFEKTLGGKFVPIFWLATEDHDFNEVNHSFFLQEDGEVGRVRFEWEKEGNPIADLPLTGAVQEAYEAYFSNLPQAPWLAEAKEKFMYGEGDSFCSWIARLWSERFSSRGLVLVEPEIIRQTARSFFRPILQRGQEVRAALDDVTQRLSREGYPPAITSEKAGLLYTYDATGRRVRVEAPQEHGELVWDHPERYSTDAVFRPLLADALLPNVASVLGPGEIAYHAMLKPIYEMFHLHQPVLFPRKSYTLISTSEAVRLEKYKIDAAHILAGELEVDRTFRELVPSSERELFSTARKSVEDALKEIRPELERIDPSLEKTWSQTLSGALRGIDKLEGRAIKAQMSKKGFSKRDLQALRNALLPKGKLQERIFPLAHFVANHGFGMIDALFPVGELNDFSHFVVTLEENDA